MYVSKSRPRRVVLLFFVAALVSMGCARTSHEPLEETPPALTGLIESIDARVANLQRALKITADSAAFNGPDTQAARTLTSSQFKDIPATVYILDRSGALVNTIATAGTDEIPWDAVPRERRPFRGYKFDLCQLLPDGRPIIDARLKTDQVTVIARVHTQPFLEAAVEPVLGGTNIDCWIMEPNGMQIYEPDPEEVGKNLLTDPMYEEYTRLIELAHVMEEDPSGTGSYEFLNTGFDAVVDKHATWETFSLLDIEWRVVMVQLQLQGEDVVFPDDSDVIFEARSMKMAAHSNPALAEFRSGNEAGIRGFFQSFLNDHAGIYNLAYITKQGVIVYGEPAEHSFDNYNLTEGRRPNDVVLLEATRATNDTWLVFDLAEGDKGLFYVVPVWDDEEYLGAVYMIWVLPE